MHRRRRRLRHDALLARRAEVQLLHQHPERRRHRPAGDRHRRPADPVRVQHQDLRLRARQRQHASARATCSATAATSASTTSTCRLRRAATTAPKLGVYVQDEIFLNDHFRLNIGARVDKFDEHRRPGVLAARRADPQAGAPITPSALSYNKAFRSPSLINNFLDTTIINQVNLGADQPGVCRRRIYNFPVHAIGNEELCEEIDGVDRAGLHRRHQQPRDGLGRGLLHEEHGRDLLHADRRATARQSAAGVAAALRRCRRRPRWACSKCCRRRARR